MSRDIARAAAQFFGGRVCLDFANTLDWRTSDDPVELIPDYPAFLAWSARRGTLTEPAAKALRLRASSGEAGAVMERAWSLRREIWRIAETLRERRAVDLNALNGMLSALPPQPSLVSIERGYGYSLSGIDLEEPLWPVLWSLTALLASDDAARIGVCQGTGCGWYFVDESPNRKRVWCSSEVCGNRERVRRSYAKRRRSEKPAA